MPTLRDAGRGVTAGIYDSADTITSVGGLIPNRVSRLAGGIADNIRASNEIPNSEIERVGELTSEGFAGGLAGGVAGSKIGRALGSKYKSMKQDAEKFNANIKRIAREKAEMPVANTAHDPRRVAFDTYESMRSVPPKQNVLRAVLDVPQRKPDLPHTEPITGLQKVKQRAREYIIKPSKGQPSLGENWMSRGVGSMSNNVKRSYGNAGMLQKNDNELAKIWKQSKSLDEAIKTRQKQWDTLPYTGQGLGMNMGAIGGAVAGSNGL